MYEVVVRMNNYRFNIEEIYRLRMVDNQFKEPTDFKIQVLNKELFPLPLEKLDILDEAHSGYISPQGDFYPAFNIRTRSDSNNLFQFGDGVLDLVLKDETLRNAYPSCKAEALRRRGINCWNRIIDFFLVENLKYCKFDVDKETSKIKIVYPRTIRKASVQQMKVLKYLAGLHYCDSSRITYLDHPILSRGPQLVKS